MSIEGSIVRDPLLVELQVHILRSRHRLRRVVLHRRHVPTHGGFQVRKARGGVLGSMHVRVLHGLPVGGGPFARLGHFLGLDGHGHLFAVGSSLALFNEVVDG